MGMVLEHKGDRRALGATNTVFKDEQIGQAGIKRKDQWFKLYVNARGLTDMMNKIRRGLAWRTGILQPLQIYSLEKRRYDSSIFQGTDATTGVVRDAGKRGEGLWDLLSTGTQLQCSEIFLRDHKVRLCRQKEEGNDHFDGPTKSQCEFEEQLCRQTADSRKHNKVILMGDFNFDWVSHNVKCLDKIEFVKCAQKVSNFTFLISFVNAIHPQNYS